MIACSPGECFDGVDEEVVLLQFPKQYPGVQISTRFDSILTIGLDSGGGEKILYCCGVSEKNSE